MSAVQLDLFGNPTEQAHESGEVLVRSHMRRVKGAPPAGNPPVAYLAPQPAPVAPRAIDSARVAVKTYLNGLYPHWATSRQIVAQTPCPERWVLRVLADLKAENRTVELEGGGFYLSFRLAPCAPSPVPHNGTATSKAAAKHLEQTGAAGTQIARILAVVKASGARGLTREEIHIATGISVASVCGRVNTLLGKGLLRETGTDRESSAGRWQAVVVAKEFGRMPTIVYREENTK